MFCRSIHSMLHAHQSIRAPYLYFKQTSPSDGQMPHARGRFSGAHFLNQDAISMHLDCPGLIRLRLQKEKVYRLTCPLIAGCRFLWINNLYKFSVVRKWNIPTDVMKCITVLCVCLFMWLSACVLVCHHANEINPGTNKITPEQYRIV